MKSTHNTTDALELLNSLSDKILDSHHWIGNNHIRLDAEDTKAFITDKLVNEKYITTSYCEVYNRIMVEISLSGRNQLNISLR